MSRFVVDACVAVKWVVTEEHSDAALRFLMKGDALVVPDLFFPEIGNVFCKKCRQGELSLEDAKSALRDLLAISLEVHPTQSLVVESLGMSSRWGCSVYDGVYLALAARQGCSLVTADQRFIQMMRASGFSENIMWIEEAAAP
jgi:predicted nucleic acid-binding protein